MKEIDRAFCHFNYHLFDNAIPSPQFVVLCEKRLGFRFAAECPPHGKFLVGCEVCRYNKQEFLAEMLHEMVHAYNAHQGIVDVTSNQYHNGEFLTAALRIGLFVRRQKTRCWGYTSLNHRSGGLDSRTPDAEAARRLCGVVADLDFDFGVLREARSKLRQRNDTPKKFLLKWVCECPPPHNSVRSGRRPHSRYAPRLRCELCKALLKPEEEVK